MHMEVDSGRITNAVIAYGLSGAGLALALALRRASPTVVRDYLMIVIVVPLLSLSGSLLPEGA
jgi:hypothetical protein